QHDPNPGRRLEVRAETDGEVPRQSRRQPALHRIAGARGVLRVSAEILVAPVEQVAHHAAQLERAPGEGGGGVCDAVVGEAARRVAPMFWKYPPVTLEAMKKMSSRTADQYAVALASSPAGLRKCHPSS